MSEADRIYDAIFSGVRAIFNTPAVKAYYRAEAEKNAKIRRAEEARIAAERLAVEQEAQRSKSYDIWALNGGADECTQFGIRDGCKPECPVFQRGQCIIQADNEELFAEIRP